MPLLVIELGPIGDGLGVTIMGILKRLIQDVHLGLRGPPCRLADVGLDASRDKSRRGVRSKAVGAVVLTVLSGLGLEVFPRVALAPRTGESIIGRNEILDVRTIGAEAGGHAARSPGALGRQLAHSDRSAVAVVSIGQCLMMTTRGRERVRYLYQHNILKQ